MNTEIELIAILSFTCFLIGFVIGSIASKRGVIKAVVIILTLSLAVFISLSSMIF